MIKFYLDSGFTTPITQIQTQTGDGTTTTFTLDPTIFDVTVFSQSGPGEIRLFNPQDVSPYSTYNGTLLYYNQSVNGYTVDATTHTVTFTEQPTSGYIIQFFDNGDSNRLFDNVAFIANGDEAQRTQVKTVYYKEDNQYNYSNVEITPISLAGNPFTNIPTNPDIQIGVAQDTSFNDVVTNSQYLLGSVPQNGSGSFQMRVIQPYQTDIVSNWRIQGFSVSGVMIQSN